MIGDTDLAVAKLYNMLPADEAGTSEGRTAATNASCAPTCAQTAMPSVVHAGQEFV